jgi:hypothetical protein
VCIIETPAGGRRVSSCKNEARNGQTE